MSTVTYSRNKGSKDGRNPARYLGGHVGTGTWLVAQHRFKEALGSLSQYKLKEQVDT